MHIKTANGKKKIVISRKEWDAIGKKAGWENNLWGLIKKVNEYVDMNADKLADLNLGELIALAYNLSDLPKKELMKRPIQKLLVETKAALEIKKRMREEEEKTNPPSGMNSLFQMPIPIPDLLPLFENINRG